MALAYILVNVKNRQESRVAQELVQFKEVIEIHLLYGLYDMILKVKTKDLDTLNEFAHEKIKFIKDISTTATMIVADKTKEDNRL